MVSGQQRNSLNLQLQGMNPWASCKACIQDTCSWGAYPSLLLTKSYRVLGVTDSKQASIHVRIRGCSRTSRHTKIADLQWNCRWVLLLHLGPRRLLYTVAVGIIQELLWLMCAFANSILHSAATSGLRWALDDDLLLGVEVSQWTQPVFLTGTTALNRKYCMDLFFGGYVFVCCRRFCLGAGDAIDVVLFYLYFCDLAVVVRCQWLIFFCKILLFIYASFLYLAIGN